MSSVYEDIHPILFGSTAADLIWIQKHLEFRSTPGNRRKVQTRYPWARIPLSRVYLIICRSLLFPF